VSIRPRAASIGDVTVVTSILITWREYQSHYMCTQQLYGEVTLMDCFIEIVRSCVLYSKIKITVQIKMLSRIIIKVCII